MSQLVRLEGKHTYQNAHCAVMRSLVGLKHLNLHLDEGHLVLGQNFNQGSIGCGHLAHGDSILQHKGRGAVEVEATHVHEGGVHPAVWARTTPHTLETDMKSKHLKGQFWGPMLVFFCCTYQN